MISDIRITDDGDIDIESSTGDIALTGGDVYEQMVGDANTISQIALIALKTEQGDFIKHESLGSLLHTLIGFPNKPATANAGKKFILNALKAHGISSKILIESWPEDLNTIGYEVKIGIGGNDEMLSFTMFQTLSDLGVEA